LRRDIKAAQRINLPVQLVIAQTIAPCKQAEGFQELFLGFPQVARSTVWLAEHRWDPIATSGGPEKTAKAKRLGAHLAIDYTREDVLERVREATSGKGVDLVLENVGQATFATSVKALRKGGRIVTAGATTGGVFPVDIGDLYWRQLAILGSTMGGPREFAAVSRLVFSGKVRPAIDRVRPLTQEDVRGGHADLEKGVQFGKIVFRVASESTR